MKKRLSILVTGAGAPGIRGTLYCLTHNPDRCPVRTVGADIRDDAVGRYLVDRFHRLPPPEDPAYVDALAALCSDESVDLVIPQTTREIAVLSARRDDLAARGVPVMVSAGHALARANNKLETVRVFEDLGLPFPAYRRATSRPELLDAVHALGYPERPVVVKPPVSNGMRGLRILRRNAWTLERFLSEKPSGTEISLDDLIAILASGPQWAELLVTEYLPGAEYSVDAFAGRHAAVAVPRLRKTIRSGISFETVLQHRPDMAEWSLRAGRAIGLQFAFGFQFKLDAAGVPKVLECNPRVQGTMVAPLFGGVNIIWLAVREALGDPPTAVPEAFDEAVFSRFWGGVGVRGDRVDEI